MSTQPSQHFTAQRIGLYCNWIFVALTAIGWLGIAHFYMPAPADLSLAETKEWFSETYRFRTLIGCSIFYVATGFLVPGSLQFTIMLAKIEGRWPIWSLTTGVCGIFISLIVFFNACAWIVASYRVETSADVIQSWSDWAWMAFLLGWIYLTVEMLATAFVELMDRSAQPLVPRWLTWSTIAGAISLVTAGGPAFFKSGPFAYHGLFAFYIPVGIWGGYIAITTWYMLKALDREAQAAGAASASAAETYPAQLQPAKQA